MRRLPGGVAAAGLLVCGASLPQVVTGPVGPDGFPLYAVECPPPADAAAGAACAVDRYTYVGWRVFHRRCSVCHAQDAVGSRFAPNLLSRVRQMAGDDFLAAMQNGYAGDAPIRPWGRDPEVRPYFFELWAYLSARASGDLPPGTPRHSAD